MQRRPIQEQRKEHQSVANAQRGSTFACRRQRCAHSPNCIAARALRRKVTVKIECSRLVTNESRERRTDGKRGQAGTEADDRCDRCSHPWRHDIVRDCVSRREICRREHAWYCKQYQRNPPVRLQKAAHEEGHGNHQAASRNESVVALIPMRQPVGKEAARQKSHTCLNAVYHAEHRGRFGIAHMETADEEWVHELHDAGADRGDDGRADEHVNESAF